MHLSLAALGTYALGRVLGLGMLAAVVAGAAYEFSALLEYTRCCTAYVQIMAWLPVALLGVELAVRAGSWLPRFGGWTLAGFAVSQLLGAWLGQGAYNALLVVGGFVAYRTVLAPPPAFAGLRARFGALILHGGVVMAIGIGLGAAGILPRLDANHHSTLAGGVYDGAATPYADRGGWPLPLALDHLLSIEAVGLRYYAGGATLVLAVLAPLLAGRRFAVPFFAVTSVLSFALTLEETPLHRLFYLLPRFELIHEHYPERALVVFYLGLALLAGATVAALPRWHRRWWALAIAAALPLVALLASLDWLQRDRPPIDPTTPRAVAAASVLLIVYAVVRVDWVRRVVPVLLLLTVIADPNGLRAVSDNEWHERAGAEAASLLAAYQSEEGAAGFLLARQAEGPVRYTGYDIASTGPGMTYHSAFQFPIVPALLVNNRATYVGLHDLSGYNPVQPERFRTLLDALNQGQPQDYHQTNLLPAGLDAPLLDLLGVRYLVIPATQRADRADLTFLRDRYPVVYTDGQVQVRENPDAFPRAWLVHDAHQVPPGGAVPLLTGGSLDLRTTVVLETEPPPLGMPTDPSADTVTITAHTPDRVSMTATTDAPGLVVLSDTYDPGWVATVDGAAVPVLVADHALRAIPVGAGMHTIELRYAPRSLTIGLLLSLATVATLVVVAACLTFNHWRGGRRGDKTGLESV